MAARKKTSTRSKPASASRQRASTAANVGYEAQLWQMSHPLSGLCLSLVSSSRTCQWP